MLALEGDLAAWSIRQSSALSTNNRYAPVILRSNRWPGAITIGYDDKYANLYVGWGLKDLPSSATAAPGFVPPALPVMQVEVSNGTFLEQVDPTVQEERAFAEAQLAAAKSGEEGDEGAEAGDEQQEEDA